MTFAKKKIDVIIEMQNGQFAGGGNSHTATGLRTSCTIEVFGGPQQANARIAIWGIPLSIMNQMSVVGPKFLYTMQNSVTVLAGDEGGSMEIVFQGGIYSAMVDASAMPQVAFLIEAKPGYKGQIDSTKPLSIKGSADVSVMMGQIAGQLGMTFENNNVTTKMANPYYPGSLVQQASAIARDAGISWIMEKNTLAINNPGEPRQGEDVLISPETGLVGYPMFNQTQIVLKSYLNTKVKYNGPIQVKSDIEPANGKWIVNGLRYEIESEMPRGKWFMDITGYLPK